MRLSREIIVLDYGDEQTSPYDFDKPISRQRGGNCELESQFKALHISSLTTQTRNVFLKMMHNS